MTQQDIQFARLMSNIQTELFNRRQPIANKAIKKSVFSDETVNIKEYIDSVLTDMSATYHWGPYGSSPFTGSGGRYVIDFNGSSGNILFSSPSVLDNIYVSGGTIEAWVKIRSVGEFGLGRIFDKEVWAFYTTSGVSSNARLNFFHRTSSEDSQWRTITGVVPFNVETHIAVTYNKDLTSNNPLIYVNGVSVNVEIVTTPLSAAIDDSASNLLIGNNSADITTLNGKVWEARIWNDIRTPTEILDNYNKSLVGNEANLVGYWPINEKTGSTVLDKTSNGNNGTITGATWKRIVSLLYPEFQGVWGIGEWS